MPEEFKKGKKRWSNLKGHCKKLNINMLQSLLKDKQIEFSKRKVKQMAGGKMKAYSMEDKGKTPLKVIRKEIAIIQTFINQKIRTTRNQKF